MRVFVKTIFILLLLILVSPLYADDFTLDEWLILYKEGFFGEIEELPAELPLFVMDTFGLRLLIKEEEKTEEKIEERTEEESSPIEKNILNSRLMIKEEDNAAPVEKDALGLRLTVKEEDPQKTEEESLIAEENISSEDLFLEEDYFFFEGPPLVFEVPAFETRSFDDIFPHFSRRQKTSALSRNGVRYFLAKDGEPTLVPDPESGIDIISSVKSRNPSHVIEAILVLPYKEKEFDLLDIYNALGRISNIKEYPVPYMNGDLFVFTESSRIVSSRNRKTIPDPAPVKNLPFSETIYFYLKEYSIGNLYLRGDISISVYGITYNMTNFADVRYYLVPVMKAERFSTIIYIEPIKEGVLIYSMIGFYLPDFVADRVNLSPSINRRIQIFIDWITDGLRRQEAAVMSND